MYSSLENDDNSFTNQLANAHELHAIGFGVLTYAMTKNVMLSGGVGVGLLLYMATFGHGLPK